MRSMSLRHVRDDVLLYVIWAGIALLLLTPFMVTPGTVFPFVVGKALYSRALIEVVFAAWVTLAVLRPQYRPPRSRILALLGAALGVAVLAACFGASVQRSFWSSYERMQGVVDQAHWFALALVLVSVVRTARDWRVLLNLNLAAGAAIALAVGGQDDVRDLCPLNIVYGKWALRCSWPTSNQQIDFLSSLD